MFRTLGGELALAARLHSTDQGAIGRICPVAKNSSSRAGDNYRTDVGCVSFTLGRARQMTPDSRDL